MEQTAYKGLPDEGKVLIITYYWPPSGGSGVQRWLKFVKYLPQFGCKPYVFTPDNPAFAVQDKSLQRDIPDTVQVIRFPIWEPYEMFFKLSGFFSRSKKEAKPTDLVSGKKKSIFQSVSTWIRGNFFIPDPRVFWVRPSVKFLHQYLAENNINTIVTTGPPHSMHLIGYHLKKKNASLKWLADFRDPWSDWGLLDSLMTTSLSRKIHKRLEKKVLTTADEVITITHFYAKRFEELSGRKVQLLTNGFDEDDFAKIEYCKNNKFTIRHVGIVNEKCDPRPFMQAVLEQSKQSEEFRLSTIIEFIGEVHPQFIHFVNSNPVLASITTFRGSIPHKELMSYYGSSSLLLLILYGYKDAQGFMPGKLFEYVATGIPVLGVGPVYGDAANLLADAKAGEMIEGTDVDDIKKALERYYTTWKNSSQTIIPNHASKKYSRKTVTASLMKLLSH